MVGVEAAVIVDKTFCRLGCLGYWQSRIHLRSKEKLAVP
jgi:hypothetical protein